jgi:hypothetical protein
MLEDTLPNENDPCEKVGELPGFIEYGKLDLTPEECEKIVRLYEQDVKEIKEMYRK